jgi:hypothetical protein
MKKIEKNGIALLLAAITVLALAGCPQAADPLSSNAALSSVTVAGVQAASLGTPGKTWSEAAPGFVWLESSQLQGASVSAGKTGEATVYYKNIAAADAGQTVPDFQAASTLNLAHNDSLYIEVFSENHDAVLFYRILILDAALKVDGITIAGEAVTLAAPGTSVDKADLAHLYLAKAKLTNASIAVSPAGSVEYGIVAVAGVAPDSFDTSATKTLKPEDVVIIKKTVGAVTFYFQIAVHVTIPEIRDIVLDGRSASGGQQLNGIPVQQFGTGVGTPGAEWNDAALAAGEVWFDSSRAGQSLSLKVEALASDTTVSVGISDGTTQPSFSAAATVTATNGHYLYVKTGNANGDTGFYKIKLAAKNTSRAISGVKINNIDVTPGPIGTHSFPGSEAWGNYSNGAELAANGGSVAIIGNAGFASVSVTATAPQGGSILYGATPASNERNYLIDFTETSTLTGLGNGDFIALEVTSEIGEKGWYKFRVYEKDPNNTLTSLKLGATEVLAGLMPGVTGLVILQDLTSVSFDVTAAASSANATVEYGLGSMGIGSISPPSAWQASGTGLVTSAADIVYVRVTPEEPTVQANTYSFVMNSEAGIALTSFTIGGSAFSPGSGTAITDLGTPASTMGGVTAGSGNISIGTALGELDFFTGAMIVNIQAGVSTGVSYRVALTTNASTQPGATDWRGVTYPYGPGYAVAPTLTPPLANGNTIWVEVAGGAITKYYKIVLTVAALTADNAKITALNLGGVPGYFGVTGGVNVSDFGTEAAAINDAAAGSVTLDTTTAAGTGSPLLVTSNLTLPSGASCRVAKTTGAVPEEYAWVASDFDPISNNDVLWFEVKAGEFTRYYKIVVTVP